MISVRQSESSNAVSGHTDSFSLQDLRHWGEIAWIIDLRNLGCSFLNLCLRRALPLFMQHVPIKGVVDL